MQVLQIGSPYLEGRTSLPEGNHIDWTKAGFVLLIAGAGLTNEEIGGMAAGQPSEFAVLERFGILFLLSRFGEGGRGFPWSDAPYHVSRLARDAWPDFDQPVTDETRLAVTVVVADSTTGLIVANPRLVSLSPRVTRTMLKILQAQKQSPMSSSEYNDAVERAYSRYPRTEDMLRDALAKCRGGD